MRHCLLRQFHLSLNFFFALHPLKLGLDSQNNERTQFSEQPGSRVNRSVLHSPHSPQRRARYESAPTRTCVRRKSPRASEMRRMPLRQPFLWTMLPPFLFFFNDSSSSRSSQTKAHTRRFQVLFTPVRIGKNNKTASTYSYSDELLTYLYIQKTRCLSRR